MCAHSCGRLAARAAGAVIAVQLSVLTLACARAEESPQAAAADPPSEKAASAAPLPEGVVRIKKESQPFVEVQEVQADRSDSMLSAPTRIDFRDDGVSRVGAPLDGRVQVVHVSVGQRVGAGDPLVTLDCPDAGATRAAAETAGAALREARLELERQRRMQNEGVGIERDLVAAETKVASGEAETRRLEAVSRSIGAGQAASVVVRAPIAGVITAKRATVGMSADRGGDPLVEIGDPSALWAVVDVFERDLPLVHAGATAHLRFPSADETKGHVSALGAVVGAELRTAPVFVVLDDKTPGLRPGMHGRALIAVPDAAMTLPVSAVLIRDGRDPVVYVQRDPLTYERRSVSVGQPIEGRVQVTSGIAAGDKVVVKGALLLDGAADQLL